MYKIGITGSIGTGKTSIANIFALFKIPIFDADKEIKRILDTDEIIEKLKYIWPKTIKDNHINKLKLRSIIFSNKKKKIRKTIVSLFKDSKKNSRKKIITKRY